MTNRIIGELDLENINITKSMFNEISKDLLSNESYINEYKITSFDDLFISNKVDFYYILFKYILKNSIYIYYIDFLNDIRKIIIKKKQNQSSNNNRKIDNNFKDKIIYIIKFFTNSDYYVEKYINQNNGNILNSNLSNNNEINNNQNSFELSDNSKKGANLSKENPFNDLTHRSYDESSYNLGISNNQLNQSGINQNEDILKNIDNEEESFRIIIDDISSILNESTITLNINNDSKENKENKEEQKKFKIEYEKIEYKVGFDINYEQFEKYFSNEEEQAKVLNFSEKIF
jgi:hypothetical protein